MRIDQTHRPWLWRSTVIVAIAVLVYVPYDHFTVGGARGGTTIGIIYGVIGFALMIFAGLLSFRKKLPIWRMGRTSTWMRAHLWLGLIGYPIILLHSGFSFGHGKLTWWMMLIFTIVIASGVLGAALQHWMPRVMTKQIPYETIYDEIPRIRGQLLDEADLKVAEVTGITVNQSSMATSVTSSGGVIVTLLQLEEEMRNELTRFYSNEMRPYLEQAGGKGCSLAERKTSSATFDNLRTLLPDVVHRMVSDLEGICEEKRELDQQVKMQRVLHGWLFVHVPLSFALLLLAMVHAIVALQY